MSGYLGRVIAVAAALGVTLALAGPSVAAPPTGPGTTRGRPAPPPTVSSLSPAQGPDETIVTVKGKGFSKGAHVLVDGTKWLTFYDSATQVRFKISQSLAPGEHSVAVAGADGQVSNALKFLVQTRPKIMQLDSWHDKPGALFHIKGEGFVSGSKLLWKSQATNSIQKLGVTYVSASELQCKVPSNAAPGRYEVAVDNGGGLVSNLSNFLVVKP